MISRSWPSWLRVSSPGQRGQDRPVRRGQPGRLDLALEHGDLMPQD
jgi:hypothetical protein